MSSLSIIPKANLERSAYQIELDTLLYSDSLGQKEGDNE